MEKNTLLDLKLPPGFRFHPSDEELIVHYLRKKASTSPLPASIVADVELYKYNPWDLPMKSTFGDEEWYFFTPRDRKYPNGTRPNRVAASGYWKATGIDKPIVSSCGSKIIGVKKALIFYLGKPPRGSRSDWLMQEYRLPEHEQSWPNYKERSMRLDDWVLCRIWQKNRLSGKVWEEKSSPSPSREPIQSLPEMEREYTNEEVAAKHQTIQPKSSITNATLAVPSEPEMIRESILKECPMLPILSPHLPHDKIYPSLTSSTNPVLSYQTNNNNIDYLQNPLAILGKRKLPFELGIHKENINKKGMVVQKVRFSVPQCPAMDNSNLDANGMESYNETVQVEKNNNYNVQQVGSTMYQDLHSIGFA